MKLTVTRILRVTAMTISRLIQIKYVVGSSVLFGDFGKPQFVMHALDRMLESGKAAIAVYEDGTEYVAPVVKPLPEKAARNLKPISIGAIVAHLAKPENVSARLKAREEDWALLREDAIAP